MSEESSQPPAGRERRQFSRVPLQARTELHQGGVVWEVQLLDIGLNGLSVTQPQDWDADYSHPFNFIIHLDADNRFEAYAHLIHIEEGTLGFQMEHLGPEQIAPLAQLLAQKVEGNAIEEELKQLED